MTHIFGLMLALGALALGPLLYGLSKRAAWLIWMTRGFVLVAIGALILVMVLPELIAQTGAWVLVALVAGMVAPLALGRVGEAVQARTRPMIRWAAVSFLVIHAVLDGVALGTHTEEHHLDLALGAALILHRLPVGLAVWMLLSPTSKPRAWGVLALVGLATCVGFVLGDAHVEVLLGGGVAYFQVFVAGTLLHIIMGHQPSEEEPAAPRRALGWEIAGALLGAAAVWLIPHGDHGHEVTMEFWSWVPLIAAGLLFVFLRFRRPATPEPPAAAYGDSEDGASGAL